MRDYRLLLGLTLRNRMAGLRLGSWRKDNGKTDWGRIIASVIVAVFCIALAVGVVYCEIKLFGLLRTFRQEALLPALAMLLSLFSTLLLCFFHVLSSLFFSRDTAWMAYLPVRSRSVMAAKMTEIWMGEELFAAAILLPVFVLYGGSIGADALYYVRMVLIVLMAPMIPLAIVGLLTSILGRMTSIARHKEAISVVFSILIMVGVWASEALLLPKIPDDADAMFFLRILLDNEGILTMLTGMFPPVLWAIHGLQGNWGELVLYALCCIGSMALLIYLLGGGYLNACLRQGEHATRKRKLKLGKDAYKQRTPLMTLFRKEWSAVMKSPAVAFNCLPSIFIMPIIVVMSCVGMASTVDMNEFLSAMRQVVSEEISPMDLMLILTAVVTFACFMNPAVATAVSREGARLEISRMIPVTPRMQITAKLMVGMVIDMMAVGLAVVMVAFLLPAQAVLLIPVFLLSMLLCFAVSACMLTLDAVRPNLHWTSEVQVVKQGANVAFGMLIGLVMFVLPVIPPLLLLSNGPVARFAASAGVVVLEAGIGLLLLRKVAEKSFAALEPDT